MDPTIAMAPTASLGDMIAALASGDGLMTHIRTAAYFAAFLGALGGVAVSYPWRRVFHLLPFSLFVALMYSLAALLATWRLILNFFVHHTRRYAGHLDPPNLFVDAYREVCDDAAGWVWSCVLLSWVCVACPLVDAEARRKGLPPRLVALFIALAFLGAVSHAFPLLLLLLVLPENNTHDPKLLAPPPLGRKRLWPTCLFLALGSTAALPLTVAGPAWAFITALALLHCILILPFLVQLPALTAPRPSMSSASPHPYARAQYLTLAAVCCALHLASLAAAARDAFASHTADAASQGTAKASAFTSVVWHLLSATRRNHCQASISIDAVLASLAGAGYMLARGGRRAVPFVAAAPLVSPAASLALFAAVNVAEGRGLPRKPHRS
jgi:hypothetical protein